MSAIDYVVIESDEAEWAELNRAIFEYDSCSEYSVYSFETFGDAYSDFEMVNNTSNICIMV